MKPGCWFCAWTGLGGKGRLLGAWSAVARAPSPSTSSPLLAARGAGYVSALREGGDLVWQVQEVREGRSSDRNINVQVAACDVQVLSILSPVL